MSDSRKLNWLGVVSVAVPVTLAMVAMAVFDVASWAAYVIGIVAWLAIFPYGMVYLFRRRPRDEPKPSVAEPQGPRWALGLAGVASVLTLIAGFGVFGDGTVRVIATAVALGILTLAVTSWRRATRASRHGRGLID